MKRHSLSTMYGVGLLRGMPGTYGSLVAALIAAAILQLPMGYAWLAGGVVLFTLLGTAHAGRFMRDRNTSHDPSEIVIDELAGQWLTYSVWHGLLFAMAANSAAATRLLDEVAPSPIFLALGFLLFRFFDILKPWPISWVDRWIKGGFGVMLDDLLAGIAAGAVLYVCYLFSPMVMGQMESFP